MVRGVSEGDKRVTRCNMVRIMDWDQLIDYLGEVWEELWDAMLFKLKAADAVEPRLIIDDAGCMWRVGSVMQGGGEGGWMRSSLESSGGRWRIRMLVNSC